jgi:type I restriction enzyme S subunit
MAYGLGRPVLNLENIRSAPIKVGPKQHQEAVVAEIEKQFSRLDEAVANLKRVKANLTRYKAAVLKAAVEGRLVPTEAELARREGRSYETGAQLVQRILETRRSLWKGKGKYKEPAAPDPAGLRELPEGWIWSSLDQVAWDSSYGTSVKCSYDREGPPVLRIPNIEDGSVDLADLKFGPPTLQIGAMDAVAAGDMLVIRTNGSKSLIGRAAVVAAAPTVPTAYASYLIRFRLLRLAGLPAWISTVWGSSQVRSWIESRAATSAGQHNISMRVLAAAPVPVAPIGEQRRIVAEVQRRMSLGGQLERGLAANVIRSDHLRNAALSAFFSRSWSEVAEVGR